MKPEHVTTCRFPTPWLAILDELREPLGRPLGCPVTRSAVIRAALARGLTLIAAEHGKEARCN